MLAIHHGATQIVEMQLAKGGVRLAGILNNMWSGLTDEELASAGKIIAAM